MGRRREFNEDEVIDRAMEAFWLSGYRATTPAMLTQATGLSKSSLYGTFGSKEGLFLMALDRYAERQIAAMAPIMALPTLVDVVRQTQDMLIHMATTSGGPSGCMVCASSQEIGADATLAYERVQAAKQTMVNNFAKRARQAIADGELPPDTDPVEVAQFIISSNMGLIISSRTERDPATLRAIADRTLRALG